MVNTANTIMLEKALEEAGGEPIGWLFAGAIGGYERYCTKAEYLDRISGKSYIYDVELAGWNTEWGDQQTEIAKYRQNRRAQLYPERKEEILAQPLENFYMEVRHWETWWEIEERKKRETAEHNRIFWRTTGWKIISILIVSLFIILKCRR